jgi:hypothetical protein
MVGKTKESAKDNRLLREFPLEARNRKEGKFVPIEVVSMKDKPLQKRRREANKPLYMTSEEY